jgi:hypothetical protein
VAEKNPLQPGELVRVYHEQGVSMPGRIDKIEANGMLQVVWDTQPVIERMRAHPKQVRRLKKREPKQWRVERWVYLYAGQTEPCEQVMSFKNKPEPAGAAYPIKLTELREGETICPKGSVVVSRADLERACAMYDTFPDVAAALGLPKEAP